MYQVTWRKDKSLPESGHNFVDTWPEVIDWIAEIDEAEGVRYWTVSVVCDGSNPEHVEFYPEGTLEKARLMDNLAKMMPAMDHGEVSASLMNFAAKYWDPEDMVRGFEMLAHVSEGIAKGRAQSEAKKKMN
jgi:hypothetical protein|tara:strand:+ start:223 stop:615 length:393 start_codon:yes stop_codon:yes gene_type:complete